MLKVKVAKIKFSILFVAFVVLLFGFTVFGAMMEQGDLTVIVIPTISSSAEMPQPPPPPNVLPPMPPPPPPSLTTKNQNQNQPSTLYFNKIDDPVGGVTAVQLNQKKDNQTQSTTISNLPAGDYTVGIKTPAPIKSTFCDDGRTLDSFTVIPNKKTTCVVYTLPIKIQVSPLPPIRPLQGTVILPPPPVPVKKIAPKPIKEKVFIKTTAPKSIEVLAMSDLLRGGGEIVSVELINNTDVLIFFNASFGKYALSSGEKTVFELPKMEYEISIGIVDGSALVKVNNQKVQPASFTINAVTSQNIVISPL